MNSDGRHNSGKRVFTRLPTATGAALSFDGQQRLRMNPGPRKSCRKPRGLRLPGKRTTSSATIRHRGTPESNIRGLQSVYPGIDLV
jgi:hypothetical protein